MTEKELYQQWLEHATEDADLQTELKGIAGDDAAISDRFYRDLEFGTGGLRGVIGAGTYRMNIYTVRRATQGLANYVKSAFEAPSVAISYDSRIKSDVFAKAAAEVLAANGIRVHIYTELMPTPMLSYAVRAQKCSAGIMVTASHNPAKYNGYKVYGSDGCQMTIDAANAVLAEINALDMFTGVKHTNFDEAMASGMISYTPQSVIDAYYQDVLKQSLNPELCAKSGLKIVYTPLNGTGNKPVRHILSAIGIKDVTVVPEQENPDGNFTTCPYPNPEIRQAMELGLQYCDRVHPDILIGTDPDCDRCGTAVPDGKGGYRLISGNEMGVILLDFIGRSRIAKGTMPENPVAVTTIVSTDMVTAVAKKYGVELRRVLTGFKYIGEQIALLEQGGHPERYIFGFEESYGYLSGTHARDKDAVNAVLLICEAAAWYAKKGMTLGDAIDALYAEFGCYCNAQKSFAFAGETGMEKMASLMQGLRTQPLREIAGLPVEGYTDYEAEGTGLPKANVLEYRLPGGSKVIIRPSGTEPKIKAYLSAVKPTVEQANAQLARLAEAAAKLLA